jgi:hypothetical protein
METNWPPIPQVSGVKQSWLEVDVVLLSTTEGKNEGSYIRDESRRSMAILPKNWQKFYFIFLFFLSSILCCIGGLLRVCVFLLIPVLEVHR